MKGHIYLAGLLTVISSLCLAALDTLKASTPASSVTSTSALAVTARPGLETRQKKGTGVSAVLTRVISGEVTLNSLWSNSRGPKRRFPIGDRAIGKPSTSLNFVSSPR
jgi:hypothetical protein